MVWIKVVLLLWRLKQHGAAEIYTSLLFLHNTPHSTYGDFFFPSQQAVMSTSIRDGVCCDLWEAVTAVTLKSFSQPQQHCALSVPWSRWAVLSLRGFAPLIAAAIYSTASLRGCLRRLTCRFALYLFIILFIYFFHLFLITLQCHRPGHQRHHCLCAAASKQKFCNWRFLSTFKVSVLHGVCSKDRMIPL